MNLVTIESTEYRAAKAWYIMYPLDAYALGPMRFEEPVTADVVVERALSQFGERPYGLWPDGRVEEVEEYSFKLDVPEED